MMHYEDSQKIIKTITDNEFMRRAEGCNSYHEFMSEFSCEFDEAVKLAKTHTDMLMEEVIEYFDVISLEGDGFQDNDLPEFDDTDEYNSSPEYRAYIDQLNAEAKRYSNFVSMGSEYSEFEHEGWLEFEDGEVQNI